MHKYKLILVDEDKWNRAKKTIKAKGYTFTPAITEIINEMLDVIGGGHDNKSSEQLDGLQANKTIKKTVADNGTVND